MMIFKARRLAKLARHNEVPSDWDYAKCQEMSYEAGELGLHDYACRLIDRAEKLFSWESFVEEGIGIIFTPGPRSV